MDTLFYFEFGRKTFSHYINTINLGTAKSSSDDWLMQRSHYLLNRSMLSDITAQQVRNRINVKQLRNNNMI